MAVYGCSSKLGVCLLIICLFLMCTILPRGRSFGEVFLLLHSSTAFDLLVGIVKFRIIQAIKRFERWDLS